MDIVTSGIQVKHLLGSYLGLFVQNLRDSEISVEDVTFRIHWNGVYCVYKWIKTSHWSPPSFIFIIIKVHSPHLFHHKKLNKPKQISVSPVRLLTLDSPCSLTEPQWTTLRFQWKYPNTFQGTRTAHHLVVSHFQPYVTNQLCLSNNWRSDSLWHQHCDNDTLYSSWRVHECGL